MPRLLLLIACLLWGLSFPLIKALQLEQTERMPGTGSGFLAAWLQIARFGTAGLLLLVPMRSRGKPTRLEVCQGIEVGLWGGAGMAVQADALAYTEASISAFLTQAYCIFLPLIAAARTRRPPNTRTVLASVMVATGAAMLAGVRWGGMDIGRGEGGTLVAALLFTFQILALEKPRHAANRGVPVTFVMCATIALAFLPVTLVAAPETSAILDAGASGPAAGLVAALAIFPTIGAFLLMNTWQRRIPATDAGLIYTTEPVFTAIYVLFLPGLLSHWIGLTYANESFTAPLLAGGGLIVLANVLMQGHGRPHRPSIAPSP